MIVIQRERERGRDTGRGRSRLHAPGAGSVLEASLGSMNTIPTEIKQVIKYPKLLIVSNRAW